MLHCACTRNSNTADATVKRDKAGKTTAGTYDTLLEGLETAGQLRKIKREVAYAVKQTVHKKALIGQKPQLHTRRVTLVLCNDATDEEVSGSTTIAVLTPLCLLDTHTYCVAAAALTRMHA
jgi:hypothetical protein